MVRFLAALRLESWIMSLVRKHSMEVLADFSSHSLAASGPHLSLVISVLTGGGMVSARHSGGFFRSSFIAAGLPFTVLRICPVCSPARSATPPATTACTTNRRCSSTSSVSPHGGGWSSVTRMVTFAAGGCCGLSANRVARCCGVLCCSLRRTALLLAGASGLLNTGEGLLPPLSTGAASMTCAGDWQMLVGEPGCAHATLGGARFGRISCR